MYNSCGMVAIIGQLIHGYIMCMCVCDGSIRDCTRVSKQIYAHSHVHIDWLLMQHNGDITMQPLS